MKNNVDLVRSFVIYLKNPHDGYICTETSLFIGFHLAIGFWSSFNLKHLTRSRKTRRSSKKTRFSLTVYICSFKINTTSIVKKRLFASFNAYNNNEYTNTNKSLEHNFKFFYFLVNTHQLKYNIDFWNHWVTNHR